jgi:hypothetical protein
MLQSGILFFMPILVRARGVVLRHLLMLESGLFISGSQTKRQCQFDPFFFLSKRLFFLSLVLVALGRRMRFQQEN